MEGEKIKGVSIGTWVALIGMLMNLGFTYGVLDSKTKVLEAQFRTYEAASQKDREELKTILQNISEQQRTIDRNTQEIQHLRELREIEDKYTKK